jgi:hypothetical protein
MFRTLSAGTKGTGISRVIHQIGEGAAFGALITLILWAPHFIAS